MKRKMLITIALVMIMLLNCILPLFTVNAAEGEVIQLNSKLYYAVKSNLTKQGIVFTSDDIAHTITLGNGVKDTITKLDLNDSAIFDVAGLEQFSALTHVDLSGNNLTSDSNLDVLTQLSSLNYLDLSTNQIEDLSDEMMNLVKKLQSSGTVILSGQKVVKVESKYIDSEEGSDNEETANFELPGILNLAGYIKSCWKSTESTLSAEHFAYIDGNGAYHGPTLDAESIPMYVNDTTNKIEITICEEDETGKLVANYGLLKVRIHIYDDATEAASAKNPNKAAENILNGSEFILYYVVHDKSSEAITTMDTNLYYAIKEQLKGGQTINKELASYPYGVDADGETIYEEFTYTVENIGGTEYRVLVNVNNNEAQYIYDPVNKVLKRYNEDTQEIGVEVKATVEDIVISAVDETDGSIITKAGYRIPFVSEDAGINLYIDAYDEAKTFVIYDGYLTNEITSLILNNKQIRDLSGIEYFIGLESDLNVSHNYLNNIEPIYSLETQKENWESQIKTRYNSYLKEREYGNLAAVMAETTDIQDGANKDIEAIKKCYTRIINVLVEASKIDPSKNEAYTAAISEKANVITRIVEEIYGSIDSNGNNVPGLIDNIRGYTDSNKEHVDGHIDVINTNISSVYNYLDILYNTFKNEYKLTTFLNADESNLVDYVTYAEYQEYEKKTKESAESALTLLNGQIEYVKNLESQKALSEIDKALIEIAFPAIDFDTQKTETPFAEYFTKYMENHNMSRSQAVKMLDTFREIGIYSQMANYCLLRRMNEDTASDYCYAIEYLENRISEFNTEDIPTELEEKILKSIKEDEGSNYYQAFKAYVEKTILYNSENGTIDVNACRGEYQRLNKITITTTEYTSDELLENALEVLEEVENAEGTEGTGGTEGTEGTTTVTAEQKIRDVLNTVGERDANRVIKDVFLNEVVKKDNTTEYKGPNNEYFLYNQMISLANKLLQGNVDRYVKLPRLKRLDVSYNADLEDINRISELSYLYDLDASYCYIADISDIKWEEMTNLKKLSLAYNYISDITKLTNLKSLKVLDLSNNLISGKLNITDEHYKELFEEMEEFNLSGNQITDVESLLVYLDYISGGDYANYLAREDTVNIDLSNQNIDLKIYQPIYLSDYPTTIDVELPKIFTQLLSIDTARTSLGETSQNGRIESEGKYVTLNTRKAGDKIGKVVVIPMDGYDTCIGNGTTATISYTVKNSPVNFITLYPDTDVTLKNGDTKQFTAVPYGDMLTNNKINWSIKGNSSANTTIDQNGLLTIAADEESKEIEVIATADADKNVSESVKVLLPENPGITEPDDSTGDNNTGDDNTGDNNTGDNNTGDDNTGDDNTGDDNTGDDNTGDDNTGDNNTGDDNTGDNNTGDDNTGDEVGDTKRETIDTEKLGYEIGEEYLTKIKTKTPIQDFKTILLNGLEYNVVVTNENGEVVNSGYVTTGMYVKIQDKNGVEVKDENGHLVVAQIVVAGDVNKDGIANSLDSILIKAYRNEVTNLQGDAFNAADINNDGKVNIADSKLLLYHRAEVTGYSLNYTK